MAFPAAAGAATQLATGILQREINKQRDLIYVKLLGVTEYKLVEMFNNLLMRAPGVTEVRRYRFSLDPRRPAGCRVEWQIRIENTNAFQLERHLYEMVRDAVREWGEGDGPIFTFRPAGDDLDRLRDIRPWRASSSEIEFVLDRPWPLNSAVKERPFRDAWYWRDQPGAGFE